MESEMLMISDGRKTKQEVVSQNITQYKQVFDKIVDNLQLIENSLRKHCRDLDIPANCQLPRNTLSNRAATSQARTISDDSFPLCHCGTRSKLKQVAKEGENHGKFFYSCASSECRFFEWQSNTPSSSRPTETEIYPAAASTNRQQDKSSHRAGSSSSTLNSAERQCHCGLFSQRLQVKNGANAGRYFFKCVKQVHKCKFFEWEDEEENLADTNRQNVSSAAAQVCFKCKEPGHFAPSCPKEQRSSSRSRIAYQPKRAAASKRYKAANLED